MKDKNLFDRGLAAHDDFLGKKCMRSTSLLLHSIIILPLLMHCSWNWSFH